MDIGKIDHVTPAEQPAEMKLIDPRTGGIVLSDLDKTPVVFLVVGQDSERMRKAQREIIDRRSEAMRRGQPFTAEQQDDEALELTVSSVTGWRGPSEEGKPADFSPDKLRSIFKRAPAWREQTKAFSDNRANFIKG